MDQSPTPVSEPDRAVTEPIRRVVYHFSEDGAIETFVPRLAPSNPSRPPGVTAVDPEHAPLYWFPRRCPRVSVWADDPDQQRRLSSVFGTSATRICAVETGWLDRIRACRLYRYEFDRSSFVPDEGGDPGHVVSPEVLSPSRVQVIDDLLGLHASADVELRITPLLGTLVDQILESGLPFGYVRLRDARR
jgi:hypothetical protein